MGGGVFTTVPLPVAVGGVVLVRGNVLDGCLETSHQVNADLVRQRLGLFSDCLTLPALPTLPALGGFVHGSLQQLLVLLSVLLHAGQGTLVVHLHSTQTPTVQHTHTR